MEALLLLMGVASLIYGIVNSAVMNIFWGVVIIPGVFILMKVRTQGLDQALAGDGSGAQGPGSLAQEAIAPA